MAIDGLALLPDCCSLHVGLVPSIKFILPKLLLTFSLSPSYSTVQELGTWWWLGPGSSRCHTTYWLSREALGMSQMPTALMGMESPVDMRFASWPRHPVTGVPNCLNLSYCTASISSSDWIQRPAKPYVLFTLQTNCLPVARTQLEMGKSPLHSFLITCEQH